MRLETPHGLIVVVHGDTRAALCDALGFTCDIARDDRGAPVMPAGGLGSACNTGGRAAARVARDDGAGARIGVDLEHARAPRQPIETRVLTERERAAIIDRKDITRAFAIKEAIYKALDPFLRRYIGFLEVELVDGGVVTPLPFRIDTWSSEHDGFFLATARALPA